MQTKLFSWASVNLTITYEHAYTSCWDPADTKLAATETKFATYDQADKS